MLRHCRPLIHAHGLLVAPKTRLPIVHVVSGACCRWQRWSASDIPDEDSKIPNSQFETLAESTLQCLHAKIEAMNLDALEELECQEGVLSIDLGDSGVFLLNKHYLTQQIWYSSPISGAHYFAVGQTSSNRWLHTGGKGEVCGFLSSEMSKLLQMEVDLTGCKPTS
mmetsp:Transcript_66943/g.178536  ORF Transcript_66943/g.178536 Transcript_66943/m.178536 type:complete len:166 (+) Transcript_66943:66-563(+)